jgi:hypothetical protein
MPLITGRRVVNDAVLWPTSAAQSVCGVRPEISELALNANPALSGPISTKLDPDQRDAKV